MGPHWLHLMSTEQEEPTIETHGWRLLSAEEQNAAHPETFEIPSREDRESVPPGDAVKLLFDIETRVDGKVFDRGVDRMWVLVKSRAGNGYVGVLDNDPGTAKNLRLFVGDTLYFGPEHIIAIESPPPGYVVGKYGSEFFEG